MALTARACNLHIVMRAQWALTAVDAVQTQSALPSVIVQPSVEEASGRLEKQKKTLEGDIEKLRQDLEETR